MTLEEQNELIKANLPNMSDDVIRYYLKQIKNFSSPQVMSDGTLRSGYDDIIEALENELMNRS